MKAISLWQPYATAIGAGDKIIETRGWGTKYTGPILICATARSSFDALLPQKPIQDLLLREKVLNHYATWNVSDAANKLPHGCVIALATLTGSHYMAKVEPLDGGARLELRRNGSPFDHPEYRTIDISYTEKTFGMYSVGRYAWMLTDVKRLPQPIPCKGMQGLWTPSAELEAQVRLALALPVTDSPAKETLF